MSEKVESLLKEIEEAGGFEDYLDDEMFIMEETRNEVDESTYRAMDSMGKITRKKTRKSASRSAQRTTGMSSLERRQRSRRGAKTRRRDVSGQRKATRKQQRTMRRRRIVGM